VVAAVLPLCPATFAVPKATVVEGQTHSDSIPQKATPEILGENCRKFKFYIGDQKYQGPI
jgi:hypothetical protein